MWPLSQHLPARQEAPVPTLTAFTERAQLELRVDDLAGPACGGDSRKACGIQPIANTFEALDVNFHTASPPLSAARKRALWASFQLEKLSVLTLSSMANHIYNSF